MRFERVMSTIRPPSADKLAIALDCLLLENFTIQDKTLLEKLLTSLHDTDVPLKSIPIGMHRKWFDSVLNVYRRQTPISKNSSTHLYAFALKYLAVLVKSNDGLVALVQTRTLQSMIGLLDVASNLKESSIFNAYMSLLRALNTQKLGVEYVYREGLWKSILLAIRGLIVPAKYVEIQSSQYIADLIYKSFEYEIEHHCEPLLEDLFMNLRSTDGLIAKHQIKEFFAYNVYVKTLILLLEKLMGTKYELEACEKIIHKHSLSDVLANIQKLTNVTPMLVKNYTTLQLVFDCFTVWHRSDMECTLKSISSHTNILKDLQSYKQISNLYTQAIRYANVSNTQLKNNMVFEKELIVGQLMPLKKCTEWLTCSKYEKSILNGCIVESQSILNYCNNYDSTVNEMAISSLLNVLDIVPILKQESLDYLIIFFSTLTDQFLHSDDWLEENQARDSIYNKFLEILSFVFICWTKVLQCKLFLENVVHDSLSVPLVHSHSRFFHKSHNSTLLQNGLQLISTALDKKIHENVQCSTDDNLTSFDKLCDTLNNLLLDTRPEVRDSCLQCISSIASASKYSSGKFLIKLILGKKLSTAVLNTLKHDNDPFVKAKALECLEKMVSVQDIWESSLKESDLITHCFNLMQCESEGIIRRQTVKLFTALFVYNNLSDKLVNEICTVMVHISIKDPLWEVKTFTYEFWDYVIQKHIRELCNSEGLNDSLIALSATGCLHVLYVALKEEHDLEVQKKAIHLTKGLLVSIKSINNSLDFHFKPNTVSPNRQNSIDEHSENSTGSKQKKSRHVDLSDIILNSITATNDCELLPSLKSVNSSNIYPNDICLQRKTDAYVSINDFLRFTFTYNFNDCDARKQWVISTRSGLDSMLDDIIGQSRNCFVEGADGLDCH